MSAETEGTVVTFYSYKGGTGRTMALANVAWILAANGKRVLVVDFDLESPGLHRYFAPFLSSAELEARAGVINLISRFQLANGRRPAGAEPLALEPYADVKQVACPLEWSHFPEPGHIDFLSAGKLNTDYVNVLAGVDWDVFYDRQDGGRFLDGLRAEMKRRYDYALVDSRTGFGDVAAICTIQLPDVLVNCFTLNEQGIDGAVNFAAGSIQRHRNRSIRILPVLMRVDPAEQQKVEAARQVAKRRFADHGLPAVATESQREQYWARMQVPYRAYYNYEELLATFGDERGVPGTLLSAYEALTGAITGGEITELPPIEEAVRKRVSARFERRPVTLETNVALHYAPEDQVWAEWITSVLTSAGVHVTDVVKEAAAPPGARDLMVVSKAYAARDGRHLPPLGDSERGALAVYVADLPVVPRVSRSNSLLITGLTESAAVERVLQLVGHHGDGSDGGPRPRFPGEEPLISKLQARNGRFTGREEDLGRLRDELRADARPVVLQGMAGIGKTQLALEYAYRFRSAYDVVWWVQADRVAFLDNQFGDLGEALGLQLTKVVPENVRAVRQALNRGVPHPRWLIVFDSAEDHERVSGYLPTGPGHILITSRNPSWSDRAAMIPVEVFKRAESVEHLRSRVRMTPSEADRLAGLLGDLPIAVAAAGAWLAETGDPVDEYIRRIEEQGPRAISIDASPGGDEDGAEETQPGSLQAIWEMSLERLRTRSPGAYRLLQLCSMMDSSIASELLHSDELAAALKPFDPTVSERLVRGKLIQQVNRLALLRVEQRQPGERGGQISVHQLVQQAVRDTMTQAEVDAARHQIHVVLAGLRPKGEVDDPETWPEFRTLWPHLEQSDAVNCEDEAVRNLLIDRVRYLWLVGDFDRGLDRAHQTERAWARRLDAMAADPAATPDRSTLYRQLLYLRFNMANILRDMGRFAESKDLDDEVLSAQQDLLGPDHPHTLVTAGSLAADLRGLGQYAEALERDKKTYGQWQTLFGDEHPRTLAALNNLAASYRLMGDFARALELDQSVHRLRRVVLGERHPRTLGSAGHIGRDLREAGQYEESATWLTAVVQSYSDTSVAETRDMVLANVNLAISLRSAGRAQEAAALLDDAYDQLSRKLPYGPDTLACRLSRAVNLLAVGDGGAESELTAVLGAYENWLGRQHPHTIVCLNNLAMVKRAERKADEAVKLAAEAAERFQTVLGPDHPYTLAARTNHAVCAAESDRVDEALATIDAVVKPTKRILGADHPDTLRCRADQALIAYRLGDDKQMQVIEELTPRLAERIGAGHPAVSALREHRLLHRMIDPQPF
jgi:MinD-like ATPase involved in chromosome partitioning or flagellar assembly/tetratricopeptide (TPR) repeat protein